MARGCPKGLESSFHFYNKVAVSVGVLVEGFKDVHLMPLAFSTSTVFGKHVLEKTKIGKKALFISLLWQSWGQGFDPPQLHQELSRG